MQRLAIVGGPSHDFIAPSTGLAATWPAAGPRKLWSRALGDGYSAVAVEGTNLYTAYRRGSQDVIIALDSRTGATILEYAKVSLLEHLSWTPPTLSGTKLYVRDRRNLMALDLSGGSQDLRKVNR